EKGEEIFYYITLMNENYPMPPMPEGAREGILKGMYRLKGSVMKKALLRANLFGSGTILNEVIKAGALLAEKYKIACDIWSVTSYKELHRDGREAERWNRLHPGDPPRVSYVSRCLAETEGVFVAASDYVKALPDSVSQWFPKPLTTLGTDGFGRSESRAALRHFF